jgi:hypothetical protein
MKAYLGLTVVLPMLLLLAGDIQPNPGPVIKELSICHTNIRSLRSPDKLDHINCSFNPCIDIITVSETWLNSKYNQDNLQLSSYQGPFRRDRPDDSGYGGLLAWVKNDICIRRRLDLESNRLELMWLELNIKDLHLLIGTIYRQPNSGMQFWMDLEENLENVYSSGLTEILIIGDMNADPSTQHGKYINDFANKYDLTCLINEPTRYSSSKNSILDQILCNVPEKIKQVRVEEPVSFNDHCTIIAEIKILKPKIESYTRLMWSFRSADFNLFRDRLLAFNNDFNDLYINNDIDYLVDFWTRKFLEISKNIVPNKIVTVRPNDKPWFNNYLRRLLRQKTRMHNKAKKMDNPHYWNKFRQIRNSYFKKIKQAKKEYEDQKLTLLRESPSNNPKKWWQLLKDLMQTTKTESIPPLIVDDTLINDDVSKANACNKAFAKITHVESLYNELPILESIPDVNNDTDQINNIVITEQEVLDQLKILNVSKSYGPDGIPPLLLKEAGQSISSSLCKLFNISISSGIFPNEWKTANVHPLFKKGDKHIIQNYRPVSILNILSKIFEKIVYKHIYNHLLDKNFITKDQSGFLSGRSTVSQLCEMYHNLSLNMSNNLKSRIIFLDISKAFDQVWHHGLLHKINKIGITGRLYQWTTSYLSNRKQKVLINGKSSDWEYLRGGVPQGSVLGPLFFLVYINDLSEIVEDINIRMFADDTCLFKSGKNLDEITNILNNNLLKIEQWAKHWLIKFSPEKTSNMIISYNRTTNNNIKLNFMNKEIALVENHKHLGIILTSDLSWNKHIEYITNSCAPTLNLMRFLKNRLDRHALESIYCYFIRPKMEYGSELFAGAPNYILDKLDKIEYNAIRIITGGTINASRTKLKLEYGKELLYERRNNQALISLYKIITYKTPSYLNEILDSFKVNRPYNLRNDYTYYPYPIRHKTHNRSFFPFAIRLWNSLDPSLRNAPSLNIFKTSIKPKKPKITHYYYGSRWANIHHARLRMSCSILNYDLCANLHVIDSPACKCGWHTEDFYHYIKDCPNYLPQRNFMIIELQELGIGLTNNTPNADLLLYGDTNYDKEQLNKLFDILYRYFKETKRFNS